MGLRGVGVNCCQMFCCIVNRILFCNLYLISSRKKIYYFFPYIPANFRFQLGGIWQFHLVLLVLECWKGLPEPYALSSFYGLKGLWWNWALAIICRPRKYTVIIYTYSSTNLNNNNNNKERNSAYDKLANQSN